MGSKFESLSSVEDELPLCDVLPYMVVLADVEAAVAAEDEQ